MHNIRRIFGYFQYGSCIKNDTKLKRLKDHEILLRVLNEGKAPFLARFFDDRQISNQLSDSTSKAASERRPRGGGAVAAMP
jgi:hypothetical protein